MESLCDSCGHGVFKLGQRKSIKTRPTEDVWVDFLLQVLKMKSFSLSFNDGQFNRPAFSCFKVLQLLGNRSSRNQYQIEFLSQGEGSFITLYGPVSYCMKGCLPSNFLCQRITGAFLSPFFFWV